MCSGPSRVMPTLSPPKFAAAISGIIGLVLAVDSVFNTAGRVGFSTLSDHLKRRETVYQVIFIMSIAVCLLQIFTNRHRQRSAVGRAGHVVPRQRGLWWRFLDAARAA